MAEQERRVAAAKAQVGGVGGGPAVGPGAADPDLASKLRLKEAEVREYAR